MEELIMYKKLLLLLCLLLGTNTTLKPSAGACTHGCDTAYNDCTAQVQESSAENNDGENNNTQEKSDGIRHCNDELKYCYLTCN